MMVLIAPQIDCLIRPRRNRKSEAIRSLVRETHLKPSDFVAPLFVIEGYKKKEPISSLPNIYRLSLDFLIEKAMFLHQKGIQAIALFPVISSELKTPFGEEAYNPKGLLYRAIQELKREIPSLVIIADIALDPFTSHGHDGIVNEKGDILNDPTVACLIQSALMQAEAGVDFVAPSDMMDGRIQAIRQALDQHDYQDVGIISYAVKYASSLYAPFRDALHSQLLFGDKKTYQMDPANQREALLEADLDQKEGADILMVKPATLYLDVIHLLKQHTYRPVAAYHVSGEYAMVMAAHERGWLQKETVFYETLLSTKRAGADIIFTYAVEELLSIL